MTKGGYLAATALLAAATVTVVLWSAFSGTIATPPREAIAAVLEYLRTGVPTPTAVVVLDLRLARSLLAAATGAALGASGAAFQGFFRNPLADPFVIGASSGAALGAALALVLGLGAAGPVSGVSAAAFLGALVAVALAFGVSRFAGDPPPAAALLLAGTALSSLFSAALSLVVLLKDRDLQKVYYWLLGGFSGSSWGELWVALPPMGLGVLVVLLASRPLDLLAFGDDAAEAMGLDVRRARAVVAAGASLSAAAAVAAAGIIGFVGLVAPHVARLVIGPSHRRLVPAAALCGAFLVSAADLAARTIAPPLELPVGVITSAAGAPFFLWLLARRGRSMGV